MLLKFGGFPEPLLKQSPRFLRRWHNERIERFLRDSTGRETDFLVTYDERPWFAVEVKTNDKKLSKHLLYFKEKLDIPFCYQAVYDFDNDFIKGGIRVLPVSKFLTAFP